MTPDEVMRDLAPSRFVTATNLSALIARLRAHGLSYEEAEEIITSAFTVGCDASSAIWRKCTQEIA